MLRIVNEEEYIETLKWLSEDGIESIFKPELTKRKNHKEFIFMKMEEEDGSNKLQAMASVEIYETKNGNVALFNTLFVMPEFRGNKYGEIIVSNLINYLKENVDNLYSFMVNCNEESVNSFLRNGFESSTSNKKSFRLYKENNKNNE